MIDLNNSIYTLSSILNESVDMETIKLDFMKEYTKFFFRFFEARGLKFPEEFLPDILFPQYSFIKNDVNNGKEIINNIYTYGYDVDSIFHLNNKINLQLSSNINNKFYNDNMYTNYNIYTYAPLNVVYENQQDTINLRQIKGNTITNIWTIDLIEFMVDNDLKLYMDAVDKCNGTALKKACMEKQNDLAEKLLKYEEYKCTKNIDVGIINDSISIALNYACKNEMNEIAKILLQRDDVNINKIDHNEYTALHYACQNEMNEIAKILLQRDDIDVSAINWNKMTALHYACKNKMDEIAKILLQRNDIDINKIDRDKCTALYYACQNKMDEIAKILLQREDIDVSAINWSEMTVLHYACKNKMGEITKILLQRNDIDINKIDRDGYTALHYACQNKMDEIAEILLQREDIVVNTIFKTDINVLYYACQNKMNEIAKILLRRKDIDVNAKDIHGTTVLHHACQNKMNEIAKILLQRKDIDVNAKDYCGGTVLHYACENAMNEVVKILLQRQDFDINTINDCHIDYGLALHTATYKYMDDDIIEIMLQIDGIDIEMFDFYGWNALHHACEAENIEAAKLLIKKGININTHIKGIYDTALLIACKRPDSKMVEMLIQSNEINVNKQDKDGNTALHIACRLCEADIVELLMKKGIDINIKNKKGQTAKSVILESNDSWPRNPDTIEYILKLLN